MIKILVVDDMTQWQRFHVNALKTILKDIPHYIETKSSATEAYETIQESKNTPYNLLISDLQMENSYEPEHAGEWFVRKVKETKEYDSTSIIIVSGAYDIKFVAERLGVSYLRKASIVNTPLSYQLALEEALHI